MSKAEDQSDLDTALDGLLISIENNFGYRPNIRVRPSSSFRNLSSYKRNSQYKEGGEIFITVNVDYHRSNFEDKWRYKDELKISIAVAYAHSLLEMFKKEKTAFNIPIFDTQAFTEDIPRYLVTFDTTDEDFWEGFSFMFKRDMQNRNAGKVVPYQEYIDEDLNNPYNFVATNAITKARKLTSEQLTRVLTKGNETCVFKILTRKTLPELSKEQLEAVEYRMKTSPSQFMKDTLTPFVAERQAEFLLNKHLEMKKRQSATL